MNSIAKIGKQVLTKILNGKSIPKKRTIIFSEKSIDTNKTIGDLYKDLQKKSKEAYPEITKDGLPITVNTFVWGMELGIEMTGFFYPAKRNSTILEKTVSEKIAAIKKVREWKFKPSHFIISLSVHHNPNEEHYITYVIHQLK